VQIPTYADSSDGVKVAIHDLGGEGPLLLFCHATGFHGRTLAAVASYLTDSYRCVAHDLRGHGSTLLPESAPIMWKNMTDDLLAVTHALAIANPDAGALRAVGHSLGGGTIALAEDKEPGTFESAWAFEPVLIPTMGAPGQGPEPGPSRMSAAAARRRAVFASRNAAFERYSSRPPFDSIRPEVLRAYVDHGFHDLPDGTVTLACTPAIEAQIFNNALKSKSLDAAGRISMPFGVGAGNETEGVAPLTRQAAATHKNLTLFEFDLDHFGPFTDPEVIAKTARTWFAAT
jgi:pimeloyl-ACP methyl ester carboxylesterase